MNVNFDWDDFSYLLATLELHPGVKRRASRVRSSLIQAMRYAAGDSGSAVTPEIKDRIEYWKAKLK